MSELIELKNIRDSFQQDLRDWFDVGHSLIATTLFGIDKIKEYTLSNPEASYSFNVPISFKNRKISAKINTLNLQEVAEIYYSHKGAITELIYGRFIQKWYDFLNQIIEQVTRYHITSVKNYSNLPKIELKLDLFNDNLLEEVPKLSWLKFDSYKGVDKTKEIEKILSKKLEDNLSYEIKKSIIVRNLLEHRQGIIQDKDISGTGKKSIKLIDAFGEEKEFNSGDKVEITISEIFRLKQVFYNAAKSLIPDDSFPLMDSDELEENKKTTETVTIAANKTDDKREQLVKKTRTKSFDKYADIAPKSKEELKPIIIKENSQIYAIVTLLMKGSTLDEFENKGLNIGTGREGSRSFFGNYLRDTKGYGIKRTVDPSDPTNINKYVFHLQLPEGVDQPIFVSKGKSKKKV